MSVMDGVHKISYEEAVTVYSIRNGAPIRVDVAKNLTRHKVGLSALEFVVLNSGVAFDDGIAVN